MTDKLPEINGWQIKRIQDISDVTGGSTPSTNEPAYWEGDIPFVTPTDITSLKNSNYIEKTRRYITEKGLNAISSDLLEPGTILLTSRATLGKAAINKVSLITNQGFANIKPYSDISGLWLLHYLRAQKRELERLSSGSTFKEVSKKSIKHMKIPVPPLVEQRGIVEVLGTVDKYIRLTDAVIERAEELKRGLMQQLLTKGIGHTEYKETLLGKIPNTWKIRRLSGLATFKNGIYKPAEYYGEGPPSIRMYNIVDEKIVKNGAPLLNVTEKELEQFGLLPGDLVINRVNTIDLVGKIGIVDKNLGPATFESKNIRLRIKNKLVLPDFLNYILNTKRKQYEIRRNAKAAIGQATITQNDLQKVLIPIPSHDEQEKTVKIISSVKDGISLNLRKKRNLNRIKQGLIQQLLSGKIRVELKGDELHRIRDGREANN